MPCPTEKLGLFLPEGLHDEMIQAAARLHRKSPRGTVRCVYERAFAQLADALDAGLPVTFPAVRGAKDRVSVRLSCRLSSRVRRHMEDHNLKLTDLAFTAIDRFLTAEQGASRGATVHHLPRHQPDRDRREDDRSAAAPQRQARR
jgi:hypothetical protein